MFFSHQQLDIKLPAMSLESPQTGRFWAPLVELHGGFADVWPGRAQGAGFAGTCHREWPSDLEKLGSWRVGRFELTWSAQMDES